MNRLNTKRLSRIIKNVEASLETQELSLSAEGKSRAYRESLSDSGQRGAYTGPDDNRPTRLAGLKIIFR